MDKEVLAQDMPIEGKKEVLENVIVDLKERGNIGIKRYGTPLKTFNGRDSLIDAYQEALDLVMYLKQNLMERKSFTEKPEKKFRIAFDLDDVILNTTPEILNNLHYYGYDVDPFEEVVNFDLINFTGASKKQLNQAIKKSLWQNLPLINSFTPEIFLVLKQMDVEVYIVSHRREEFREQIADNLRELEISDSYYQLILIPEYTPHKAKFCADNNIDIIIDDRLDTLYDVQIRAGTKTIVFDRPWNRKSSCNLDRIYYLDEILNFLPKGND